MPYEDTFGLFLAKKLEAREMSPEEVAAKANIGRRTMYSYLDNSKRPRPATLERLCDAIDIPIEWAEEHFIRKPYGRPPTQPGTEDK